MVASGEPVQQCGVPVAGYSIDLAEALSKEMGFEYRFKLVEDNNYGMKSPVNGTWNGMIGELINKVSLLSISTICFSSISGAAPQYLSDLLQPYTPARQLRSASDTRTFVNPPIW